MASSSSTKTTKTTKATKATHACGICHEKFGARLRVPIACVGCDDIACSKCVEQYILNTFEDPKCMFCSRVWTDEFVRANMTASFVSSKLARHREKVLLDREKSMLPATQPYVERTCQIRRIQKTMHDKEREIMRIRAEINELGRTSRRLANENDLFLNNGEGAGGATTAAMVMAIHCPSPNCRGFVKTTVKDVDVENEGGLEERVELVCGLCDVKICGKCHVKIDDTACEHQHHKCDPEAVKSIKIIHKDSRPCPKCNIMIFKDSGCDQMFCTMCHTPFDWKSGKVITHGHIHNPHYFAYREQLQREGGAPTGAARNHADIPCGGLPTSNEMYDAMIRTQQALHDTGHPYLAAKSSSSQVMDVNLSNLHLNHNQNESITHYNTLHATSNGEDVRSEVMVAIRVNDACSVVPFEKLRMHISKIHRLIMHIDDYELRQLDYFLDPFGTIRAGGAADLFRNNLGLRRQFMMGEIDETQFKKTLFSREKMRNRKQCVRDVLSMVRDVGADHLRNLLISGCDINTMINTVKEMEQIRLYFQDTMNTISKRFNGCVTPSITSDWRLVSG